MVKKERAHFKIYTFYHEKSMLFLRYILHKIKNKLISEHFQFRIDDPFHRT